MFVLVLVEAVERVIVQLPANIAVAVQLLAVGVGRLESILVGVVHAPLLALVLDVLVKSLSDERREIQVVFLNPLVLVLSESDCGPFHRMHNIYAMHKTIATAWPCGPAPIRV